MPRGHAPKGSFYSAEKIRNSFFKAEAEEEREQSLRENMPFLHSLIYTKIERSIEARNMVRLKKDESKRRHEETSWTSEEPLGDDDMDEYQVDQTDQIRQTIPSETMESMEGISHCEEISSTLVDQNRLKHVCLFGKC